MSFELFLFAASRLPVRACRYVYLMCPLRQMCSRPSWPIHSRKPAFFIYLPMPLFCARLLPLSFHVCRDDSVPTTGFLLLPERCCPALTDLSVQQHLESYITDARIHAYKPPTQTHYVIQQHHSHWWSRLIDCVCYYAIRTIATTHLVDRFQFGISRCSCYDILFAVYMQLCNNRCGNVPVY